MKLIINQIKNINKDIEAGFSLIETAIALTTLGVCLAYAMPLFLYAKINNSKSEIRTGALIVSQRIFDDIRSKPFTEAAMPTTDGTSTSREPALVSDNWINNLGTKWKDNTTDNTSGLNPVVIPADASLNPIPTPEKLLTFAMGRQYRTKVTYCPGVTTDNTVCTNNSRKFKVEVSFNGSKVYDLEGNYTNFQ
jgi:type II secretory pathway pseudopilin PulG